MRFSNGRGTRLFGNAATTSGVLPIGAADFFRRRLAEAVGVGLFALGAGLLVSILTYTPGDPSFNSAGNGVVGNILGNNVNLQWGCLINSIIEFIKEPHC